tara:strand:+ start:316 stop:1377 length:1062 start_codon:yes stop_codon:yes gene_type:complete
MAKRKLYKFEYVWIDGFRPWGLRSKVKVLSLSKSDIKALEKGLFKAEQWGFDGSSTGQAVGRDSDCILDPVRIYKDPIRDDDISYIVLCQVLNPDGTPHKTNKRASLLELSKNKKVSDQDPWFGMEQEYTILVSDGRPAGFPRNKFHYPRPQGIYYCSVGGDRSFGREISEEHLDACIKSEINITGTNAEVMPGQWEYQVGGPNCGPLRVSDDLWVSRWLLFKIAEKYEQTVTFDPKPELGDWNGAGCHTNYSTDEMRKKDGIVSIEKACEKISLRVNEHLKVYGDDLELRLTGDHETCSYKEFRWGVADRTASIRIPRHVQTDRRGYLEDRRPNANCDPYEVTKVILETTLL